MEVVVEVMVDMEVVLVEVIVDMEVGEVVVVMVHCWW